MSSVDGVPANRRARRRRAALVSVVVVGAVVATAVTVVTVQTTGCGRGVHTSEAALRALIAASQRASDTHDVCRWVTPGFEYTMSDVRELADTFEATDPADLTITTTDQLGTLVFLTASTPDGSVSLDVTATDEEGYRATIDLGSYPDDEDR